MDFKIKWSPEAIEDIESIGDYISRDSDFYARSVVTELLKTGSALAENPQIGRVVPELGNENIREKFVYSYRLVYLVESSEITILAVIHGKRLLENVSDRFAK